MSAAPSRWQTWAAIWNLREPPHVLAVVRMLLSGLLLWDFWLIRRHGLVEVLFSPQEVGGWPDVMTRNPVPEMYRWFPVDSSTAWGGWWAAVVFLLMFGTGTLTRVAALGFVLVSAQLAQVAPLADRGIDAMLRNILLILAMSPCGRVWSVDALVRSALGRPFAAEQPAWTRHLIVLQVAAMYFFAGIQKTALAWTPLGGFSALYLVLQDPAIARWPFAWLEGIYPLTQLAAAATMFFEYTACLVPLVYWFRETRTRPGRMRAFFNSHRPMRVWILVGVMLHIGIAASMQIGIFPWAMLSLYPAFLHVDELPGPLRRRIRGR